MKLEMEEWLARPEVQKVVGVPVEITVSPVSGNPYEDSVFCGVCFQKATMDNNWDCKYVNFYLQSLPGCCGVMVIHSISSYGVPQPTVNTVMDGVLEIIRDKARTAEWGKMVLCTTIPSQKNFTAWLRHAKFTVGPRTRNPRTNQIITTWTKDLKVPKQKLTLTYEVEQV